MYIITLTEFVTMIATLYNEYIPKNNMRPNLKNDLKQKCCSGVAKVVEKMHRKNVTPTSITAASKSKK
jgi:hypothetical protein